VPKLVGVNHPPKRGSNIHARSGFGGFETTVQKGVRARTMMGSRRAINTGHVPD